MARGLTVRGLVPGEAVTLIDGTRRGEDAEVPVDGSVVIGVPDSSLSAATGYAEASGLPFDFDLVKNRYVGRPFIRPEASAREAGVRRKLAVLEPVVRGRSVIVVDDSIVQGMTMRRIAGLVREADVRAVHVRIAAEGFRSAVGGGVCLGCFRGFTRWPSGETGLSFRRRSCTIQYTT